MNTQIHDNPNVTTADLDTVREVRKLMLAVLALPTGPLEHAVQVAHDSCLDPDTDADWDFDPVYLVDPPEYFAALGVTRQALRLFLSLRHNLEQAQPATTLREVRR